MDPLLAVFRLPKLAERAMVAAVVATLERRRVTPRALIDDALMRFERGVQREATDGVRPAILFSERDRIVRELRGFIDGRVAARLAAVNARDLLALGVRAAPFDAIVRNRFGHHYAVVLRRVPLDGTRLEFLRRVGNAAQRYRKVPLRGVLVYDFASGSARLIRELDEAGAQRVNRYLSPGRELHLRKDVRDMVLDRLVG